MEVMKFIAFGCAERLFEIFFAKRKALQLHNLITPSPHHFLNHHPTAFFSPCLVISFEFIQTTLPLAASTRRIWKT